MKKGNLTINRCLERKNQGLRFSSESACPDYELVLKLQLSTRKTLPGTLSFVPKAEVAIDPFCDAHGLLRPQEKADIELTTGDCFGRYLYATVKGDGGRAPTLRISRFLTGQAASIKNTGLVKIQSMEQALRRLAVIWNSKSSPYV